jgi:hypothetical protein
MHNKLGIGKSIQKGDIVVEHKAVQKHLHMHDGKLGSEHEASHNPPVVVDKCPSDAFVINSNRSEEDRYDMLAYQKALLDYGMLCT